MLIPEHEAERMSLGDMEYIRADSKNLLDYLMQDETWIPVFFIRIMISPYVNSPPILTTWSQCCLEYLKVKDVIKGRQNCTNMFCILEKDTAFTLLLHSSEWVFTCRRKDT
jgi:hypothetical protein